MRKNTQAISISIDPEDLKNKKFLIKFISILAGLGLILITSGYFVGQALYKFTH